VRFPTLYKAQKGHGALTELGHYLYEQKADLAARTQTLLRLQARLHEIEELQKEIRRLGIEAGIIFRDEEKLRARDALQKRVDFLLTELEKQAEHWD
jgi:hypothetical protein